jgi:arylsulfatase A-like enzyme
VRARRLLIAGTFVVLLSAPALGATTALGEETPPNILIIVTDDQREGLDVMPDTLKWFGDGGTEFTNAFVTTPLCCPSRASIMTGRYVHNTGVRTNRDAAALDQQTTLQYYLHNAGFRTGIFGKFLNSWPLSENPPNFDDWAVFATARHSYSGGQWNVDGSVVTVDDYATRFIADQAESFLEESSGDPWFLYLAPPNPHAPFTPEPQYEDAEVPEWEANPAVFEEDRSDKPPYVQASSDTFEDGDALRTAQLRTLMSADDMVDDVMSTLEDTGQLDNTLAFFISDNGFMWGEHGLTGKRVPYLQSVKIPMLARWTGRVGAGELDDRFVANIDIAPTTLDAAGVAAPVGPPMDGRSLLTVYERDRMLTEHYVGDGGEDDPSGPFPPWASLIAPNAQYVEYYDDAGAVTFTEYYDLVTDPWQLENLFLPPPELPAQLAADRSCAGESCP